MDSKVYLCQDSHCCPAVEFTGGEVHIGEEGNLVVLKREEWNLLVEMIRSGASYPVESYLFLAKQKERRQSMSKDPVCGMTVDEKKAAATSAYKGQTYYFCAVGCKKAFEANPEKYLKGGGMAGHVGHH